MEISNDAPISDITDDASNSIIYQPICTEPKSSEDKEMNDFLDSTYKEKVSKEIIQNIKDKKLRDQEKIITSQDIKSSLNVKGGQVLIQELFTPEPSLQESNIIQNHVTEISETGGPGKISSEIETGNITMPSIPLSHTSSSMTASSNSEDKIIEEVSQNEDAIASESLPETEIKISIYLLNLTFPIHLKLR